MDRASSSLIPRATRVYILLYEFQTHGNDILSTPPLFSYVNFVIITYVHAHTAYQAFPPPLKGLGTRLGGLMNSWYNVYVYTDTFLPFRFKLTMGAKDYNYSLNNHGMELNSQVRNVPLPMIGLRLFYHTSRLHIYLLTENFSISESRHS